MSVYTEISFQKNKDLTYVIHPQKNENTTGVGYDLRIGYFLKIREGAIVNEGKGVFENKGANQNVEEIDKTLTLEPFSSILVITKERVYLSRMVAGKMHARATYAGQGIVINSTTVDPNWNGRMVFLLTNISNKNTDINLSEHFCTISLHTVSHLSSSNPNDPRNVLIKYTREYEGDISNAQDYLMESGVSLNIYDKKRLNCINKVNRGKLYVCLLANKDELKKYGKFSAKLLIVMLIVASPVYINYKSLLGVDEFTIYTVQAVVGTIFGAIGIYINFFKN